MIRRITTGYRLFARFTMESGVTGFFSIVANSRSNVALMTPPVVYPCCFRLSRWVLRWTG